MQRENAAPQFLLIIDSRFGSIPVVSKCSNVREQTLDLLDHLVGGGEQ
jgi:hypothetical protein